MAVSSPSTEDPYAGLGTVETPNPSAGSGPAPPADPYAGLGTVEADPYAGLGTVEVEPTSTVLGNMVSAGAQAAVRGTGEAVAGVPNLVDQTLGFAQKTAARVAGALGMITPRQKEAALKLSDMGVRFDPMAKDWHEAAANARVSGDDIKRLAEFYTPDPARKDDFSTMLAQGIGGLAPALASPTTAVPVIAGQMGEAQRDTALAKGDAPDVAATLTVPPRIFTVPVAKCDFSFSYMSSRFFPSTDHLSFFMKYFGKEFTHSLTVWPRDARSSSASVILTNPSRQLLIVG